MYLPDPVFGHILPLGGFALRRRAEQPQGRTDQEVAAIKDFFPIKGFDHLELHVGNAKQAAVFYSTCFGFTTTAYRGLETGCRDSASYVMQQGDIQLVLTTALGPDHPAARNVKKHGDGVAVVALRVPDASLAFLQATARGAIAAIRPTEEKDEFG